MCKRQQIFQGFHREHLSLKKALEKFNQTLGIPIIRDKGSSPSGSYPQFFERIMR